MEDVDEFPSDLRVSSNSEHLLLRPRQVQLPQLWWLHLAQAPPVRAGLDSLAPPRQLDVQSWRSSTRPFQQVEIRPLRPPRSTPLVVLSSSSSSSQTRQYRRSGRLAQTVKHKWLRMEAKTGKICSGRDFRASLQVPLPPEIRQTASSN